MLCRPAGVTVGAECGDRCKMSAARAAVHPVDDVATPDLTRTPRSSRFQTRKPSADTRNDASRRRSSFVDELRHDIRRISGAFADPKYTADTDGPSLERDFAELLKRLLPEQRFSPLAHHWN